MGKVNLYLNGQEIIFIKSFKKLPGQCISVFGIDWPANQEDTV